MRNMDVFNGTAGQELADLEMIQEMITEDRDWLQSPSITTLPGPPTPPAEHLCQPQSQIHNMLKQCSSPSSKPVLVPRGTAPQTPRSFHQPLLSCSRDMASAHPSRRGRGSSCVVTSKSPGDLSSQARTDTELLERIMEKPKLVVVEEPKERGMRFRYECEGRSAGSILGASSTEANKTQPAIEIQGSMEGMKKVSVTVSLVTKDIPYRPHPHCLVGKDCPDGSGICVVSFKPQSNRRHSFPNLGVQCVRRRELDASLQKRRSQNIDPFRTGHSKSIEDMDMNVVRLCFQCELEWDDGRKDSLSPVVSNPIYDKKATTTSQLKISRLNLSRGPCTGKTEIYMLCDKVQKDDIEIIFKRGSWEGKGEFAQTDVHRQIGIVFKSPPYQEQDIAEEVEVNVVLRRLSDHMDSEPVTFIYLPHNPDPYAVKRKRKIKPDLSFTERPCVAAQSPAAVESSSSMPFHLLQAEGMLAPEERLPPAQSGASASGEINYNDPQDSILANQSYDDTDELIKHLLELPTFQAMLSIPMFLDQSDANSTFGNMDVNLNPDFGQYTQDFSQYNELQFDQLCNESHTPQSEPLPQDSASHLVQVKTEEEL